MFYYYGRKQKIFGKYPKPQFDTIIEPFAGSAAYSMNYYKNNFVLLVLLSYPYLYSHCYNPFDY